LPPSISRAARRKYKKRLPLTAKDELWYLRLDLTRHRTGYLVYLHVFADDLVECYGESARFIGKYRPIERVRGTPIWRGTVADIPVLLGRIVDDGYKVWSIEGNRNDSWKNGDASPLNHGLRYRL
jgi:hypothetical protein